MVPRVKVLLAIAMILSNAILPDGSWLAFALTWLVILFINEFAELGLGFSLKRSVVALPFALVAISAVFSPFGKPLATWDLGFIVLTPTDFGVFKFISILIRSWLSIQIAILLAVTTQFHDLIHALEHLRVPRVLTTIIAFLYRYLYVLSDEVFRMLRARQARSAGYTGTIHGGSLLWRIKVTGGMAGQLLLRSYERADRIYNAMLSRGYAGHIRTLHSHSMKSTDWITLLLSFCIIALIQCVGWML